MHRHRIERARIEPIIAALFVAVAAASFGTALAETPVRDAVARLTADADAGGNVGTEVASVADLGAEAAIECGRRIDPAKPQRNAVLLEVIARAAQGRRSHAALLKLYDPAAHDLYYTSAGAADQEVIGRALTLETWPPRLPEAMVHAAPIPTLRWLGQQAASDHPQAKRLAQVWQAWGFWARAGHERQYAGELDDVALKLFRNPAILADASAWAALVRFAGEVRASSAAGLVIAGLADGPPEVRAQAALTCARLASDASAAAIERAASREAEPVVQQEIATAAEAWPDRAAMGAAMGALFDRAQHAAARREVLLSAARATWPNRADLLARAFAAPGDGVLGAALLAIAARPEPALLDRVLAVAQETATDAQPPLIDALAAFADARATPHLTRWLAKQENPVVRVKLLLALERTSQHESDELLLRVLKDDPSAMVVEQCIGVVSRKRIAGADEVLRAMVVDATAPMQLRVAAIFGLGRFDTPEVRRALAELDRGADEVFKNAVDIDGGAARPESIDMARMMLALAEIQLGEPEGDAKLQAAYDRGTGMSQLTALVMLAQTGRDHPIIAQGLETVDTAILLGATRAAAAANPIKYRDRLVALRHAPFVESMLASGLDSANLQVTLDAAVAAGVKK